MYMTLDFSKIRPRSLNTALRSVVVIGGWGIYMLIIALRAFLIQKLESRNSDIIDKVALFIFLVISKDIILMGGFLN